MLHLLKRHPIAVRARFRHCLVLAYAVKEEVLRPLLPPGLTLDTFKGLGFVAIALVKTEHLRPGFLPEALGQGFFLSGYRIFARYTNRSGQHLRGLRILRSDTDRVFMKLSGNLMTHYRYRLAKVRCDATPASLHIQVHTPGAEADLDVEADLSGAATLPAGSPFATLEEARPFAGPLPFTFDYEEQTHSMIIVKGVRKAWSPLQVAVTVRACTFLERPPFAGQGAILASAFYLHDVPYEWRPGTREPLPRPPA